MSDLVSVGMPVHNGAATLRRALDSVLGQTYDNLDVVVSDNASTDDTAAIATEFAARDARVRFFRQPRPITAWDNFHFVFHQAKGDYFFWAADDDLHTPDYVEALVAALSGNPRAALAVTDVVRFHPDTEPSAGTLVRSSGGRVPGPYAQLLRDVILSSCSEFYGLFRTQHLREFPWNRFDYGPDHILLFFIRLRGDVVHAPGALFFESVRRSFKPRRQRVKEGFYGTMGRFRMVRFSWQMARVASSASSEPLPLIERVRVAVRAYLVLRITLAKVYVYEHAPSAAVRLWRKAKPVATRSAPAV